MDEAAKRGDLEELIRLHEKGYTCTEYAMIWAARHGHLEVVKWLHYMREESCTCTTWAIDCAAANGHFEIIKFLHEKGYTCTVWAMNCAAGGGYLHIVKWFYENRTEGCTVSAMDHTYSEEIKSFLIEKYTRVIRLTDMTNSMNQEIKFLNLKTYYYDYSELYLAVKDSFLTNRFSGTKDLGTESLCSFLVEEKLSEERIFKLIAKIKGSSKDISKSDELPEDGRVIILYT